MADSLKTGSEMFERSKDEDQFKPKVRLAKVFRRLTQLYFKYGLLLNVSESLMDSSGRYVIKFYQLLEPNNCPIYVYLYYLSHVLVAGNFVLVSLAQWYSNQLYSQWNPKIVAGANKTKDCALIGDILVNDTSHAEKVHLVFNFLDSIGHPFHPKNDLAFIKYYIIAAWLFIVLYTRINHLDCKFSLSPINLIINPLQQLYHDDKNMGFIIDRLIEHKNTCILSNFYAYRGRIHRKSNDNDGIDNEKSINRKPCKNYPSCICQGLERLERLRLMNIVSRMGNINKIWHRTNRFKPYRSLLIAFTFMIIRFRLDVRKSQSDDYLRFETKIQVSLRNETSQCIRWHPNATLIHDPSSHPEFNDINSKLLIPMELSLFNSVRGNLIQLFSTKAKLFNLLMLFQIFFLYSLVTGTCFLLLTIILSFINRIVWSNQISEQMYECLKLLQSYNLFTSNNEKEISRKAKIRFKLEESLTMTIINFKLYLTEDREHRNNMNFTSTWAALNLLLLSPLMSVTQDNATPESTRFIQEMFLTSVIFSNFFIFISLRILNHYRRIFRQQSIIVGHLIISDLQDSMITHRWRQMMLDDSRVQEIFPLDFLGLKLDEDRVMSMNSSLIGAFIWLIARDTNRSKT